MTEHDPDPVALTLERLGRIQNPTQLSVQLEVNRACPGWDVRRERTEWMWSAMSPTHADDGVVIWADTPSGLVKRIRRYEQRILAVKATTTSSEAT